MEKGMEHSWYRFWIKVNNWRLVFWGLLAVVEIREVLVLRRLYIDTGQEDDGPTTPIWTTSLVWPICVAAEKKKERVEEKLRDSGRRRRIYFLFTPSFPFSLSYSLPHRKCLSPPWISFICSLSLACFFLSIFCYRNTVSWKIFCFATWSNFIFLAGLFLSDCFSENPVKYFLV